MTATEVLVVILSLFLAMFLIVGIVLGVLLIRVTQQIRRVTISAENAVEGVERSISNVHKVAIPTLLAKFVVEQVNKRRKGKR